MFMSGRHPISQPRETFMNPALLPRLSAMMFMQFFVWGAWYVTVGNYMKAIGIAPWIGWAYTVSPLAAIVSPFFLGVVADRYFAAQRVLGVLHLIGAAAIAAAPFAAKASEAGFIALLLVHALCYMPTIGLTNTLAFRSLSSQEKQFPLVRMFGTLGWIAANILVSGVMEADKTALPLFVAGGAGLVMGLYSISLPHTPPAARGDGALRLGQIVGLDALRAMSSRPFWVFIVASMLICIPLSAYYAYAPVFVDAMGLANAGFKMSFGQMSEVAFMLVMPVFFARLGVKWMLVVGMAAWVVRYGLFSAAPGIGSTEAMTMLLVGGIVLHGICYDFFFVTGYIYTDSKAPPAMRGQAQGFVVLATLGIGMLIGAQIAGALFNQIVDGKTGEELAAAWRLFWMIPTAFAAVVMAVFAVLFNDRPTAVRAEPALT
jgi:nucleoside transporter